jgi:essential nuclear protein 1
MPKAKSEKKSTQLRHAPLSAEIEAAERPVLSNKHKVREGRGGDEYVTDEAVEDLFDAPAHSMNAKIFQQAKEQRKEEASIAKARSKADAAAGGANTGKAKNALPLSNDSDDYESDDLEEDEDYDGEEYVQVDGNNDVGYVSSAGLAEEEEAVVARFLKAGRAETRTLADIIIDKMRENQATGEGDEEGHTPYDGPEMATLPPKVAEVYTAVGAMLAHYKSGKLPKALKMLPHLKNWEDVLWVTRPDTWSPGGTYACTRIFASNLNERMSQRFFNLVLLEKVRDDIRTNNKLNYHLYMSLQKALFKPASFYKGILLPLAQSGTCTLREAAIIGSVLAKVSIPMNHSAAALLKLAEMPYNGSTSLFIKILVNKKYSLPRRVIDGLVDHFCNFISEARALPVIWHQSLLVFAQRYKLQISDEQREGFKELLKVHQHHQITQEVRRELFNSANAARDNASMTY